MAQSEYRLLKRNEERPRQLPTESFASFIERVGGGSAIVHGRIGHTGTKNHKLVANWIPLNGDKIIVYAYSICGSQRWGSNLSVTFAETCTCKKCNA